jgi:hypothetical protein
LNWKFYPKNMNKFFIDTIQEISMEQIVDFPTRLDNILDLVFTTHPSLANKCKPLPGIGDHDIVLIDASIGVTSSKKFLFMPLRTAVVIQG